MKDFTESISIQIVICKAFMNNCKNLLNGYLQLIFILIELIKTKLIYKGLSMKYFTGIEKKTYITVSPKGSL